MLLVLMMLVFLGSVGLPELSVLDWFLPAMVKYSIMSIFMILFTFVLLAKYRLDLDRGLFITGMWLLLLLVVSQMLRAALLHPLNVASEMIVLGHFFFTLILLMYVVILHKYNFYLNRSYLRWFLILALAFVPVSFFLYLANPFVLFSFYDHSGHYERVIYASLSSSVNNLSGFSFPRLSFVFDEPGTFGSLISLVVGFLLAKKRVDHRVLVFVLFVGMFSISMSYFIVTGVIILLYMFKSVTPMLLKGDMYAIFGVLCAFAFLLSAYAVLEGSVLASYIGGRLTDIFDGNHNRASGNDMALSYLWQEVLGLPSDVYEKRLFPSSGLLVLGAYKGWLFILVFLLIYSIFLLKLHQLGYRVRYLLVAIFVLSMTRNNIFNVSGAFLVTLACIISNILGNRHETKI